MATVQGIREKVQGPLYDCLFVKPKEQLRENENSSILKFFVNVQNKTKLLTNVQSASLLSHYNTFEARAMRVVISDLPAEFPDDPTVKIEAAAVTDDEGHEMDNLGRVDGDDGFDDTNLVTADFELPLDRLADLIKEINEGKSDDAALSIEELQDAEIEFTLTAETLGDLEGDDQIDPVIDAGGVVLFSKSELLGHLDSITERQRPLRAQIEPGNGSGNLISKFVYNTVTTFYVGEKIMIQVPTWFFPAGAGPYSDSSKIVTHGEPSPLATFRFAEPIFIDRQQNFRVEIETPDGDTLKELQRIYGPFFIWVVLDGYLTRDVQ
jgi:hypothetical protein